MYSIATPVVCRSCETLGLSRCANWTVRTALEEDVYCSHSASEAAVLWFSYPAPSFQDIPQTQCNYRKNYTLARKERKARSPLSARDVSTTTFLSSNLSSAPTLSLFPDIERKLLLRKPRLPGMAMSRDTIDLTGSSNEEDDLASIRRHLSFISPQYQSADPTVRYLIDFLDCVVTDQAAEQTPLGQYQIHMETSDAVYSTSCTWPRCTSVEAMKFVRLQLTLRELCHSRVPTSRGKPLF